MSESNRIIIRAVKEVTVGTTPIDDAGWVTIPQNGDSLSATPDTVQSQRIRGTDRMPTDLKKVSETNGGGVDFELSYGDFDTWLEAAMRDTWTTDAISVGTTINAYTIEKEFADLTKFVQIKGCQVSQMSLTFTFGSIVTGSIAFSGLTGYESATSLVGTGSTAAISANPIMAGNVDMDSITYDGAAVGNIVIRELTLDINNNLRPNNSLLSVAAVDQKAGTANVSGHISAYVGADSWAMYTDMLGNTAVDLAWTITDAAGKGYTFSLPNIKLSGPAPAGSGENTDVMMEADFLCIVTSPTITRIP